MQKPNTIIMISHDQVDHSLFDVVVKVKKENNCAYAYATHPFHQDGTVWSGTVICFVNALDFKESRWKHDHARFLFFMILENSGNRMTWKKDKRHRFMTLILILFHSLVWSLSVIPLSRFYHRGKALRLNSSPVLTELADARIERSNTPLIAAAYCQARQDIYIRYAIWEKIESSKHPFFHHLIWRQE